MNSHALSCSHATSRKGQVWLTLSLQGPPSMAPPLKSVLWSIKSINAGWMNECTEEWIHNKPYLPKRQENSWAQPIYSHHQYPPSTWYLFFPTHFYFSSLNSNSPLREHIPLGMGSREPLQLSLIMGCLMWDTAQREWSERNCSQGRRHKLGVEPEKGTGSSVFGWKLKGIWKLLNFTNRSLICEIFLLFLLPTPAPLPLTPVTNPRQAKTRQALQWLLMG